MRLWHYSILLLDVDVHSNESRKCIFAKNSSYTLELDVKYTSIFSDSTADLCQGKETCIVKI